jgi:hypothetical protein
MCWNCTKSKRTCKQNRFRISFKILQRDLTIAYFLIKSYININLLNEDFHSYNHFLWVFRVKNILIELFNLCQFWRKHLCIAIYSTKFPINLLCWIFEKEIFSLREKVLYVINGDGKERQYFPHKLFPIPWYLCKVETACYRNHKYLFPWV